MDSSTDKAENFQCFRSGVKKFLILTYNVISYMFYRLQNKLILCSLYFLRQSVFGKNLKTYSSAIVTVPALMPTESNLTNTWGSSFISTSVKCMCLLLQYSPRFFNMEFAT